MERFKPRVGRFDAIIAIEDESILAKITGSFLKYSSSASLSCSSLPIERSLEKNCGIIKTCLRDNFNDKLKSLKQGLGSYYGATRDDTKMCFVKDKYYISIHYSSIIEGKITEDEMNKIIDKIYKDQNELASKIYDKL